MRKLSLFGLLFLGACAHQPVDPPLRVQLMNKCAAACDPGEPVLASISVDWTDDLWQCVCKVSETTTSEGI